MIAGMHTRQVKRSGPGLKYSILIPSWNNLDYLKVCIESIRRNSTYKHQLIVHVNEGNDGTLEWIESQPDIDYTWSKMNIGVCYALNMGRPMVSTDYIVYVNDDMYMCPRWDEELDREVGAIGHNFFFLSSTAIEPQTSTNCAIQKNYGRSVQDFREEELLREFDKLPMSDWQGSTWPPNIVHRELWDLVGGYSIEFSPGMYSDPDFSMKLWMTGVRLFKGVSKSRAYHFGSKSTTRIVKNRGYYRFISKWGYTTSYLTTHLLKRGEPFTGPLPEFEAGKMLKLKNFWKRIGAAM